MQNHQNETPLILLGDRAHATTLGVPRKSKPPVTPLGERVRQARERRGLTQKALAKAAHLPQSAISQIETGERSENFETRTFLELERVLGLWPGELAALMGPRDVAASRERFIERHKSLLEADDIADLRRVSWSGPGEDPPDEAWFSIVYARRMVRQRASRYDGGEQSR